MSRERKIHSVSITSSQINSREFKIIPLLMNLIEKNKDIDPNIRLSVNFIVDDESGIPSLLLKSLLYTNDVNIIISGHLTYEHAKEILELLSELNEDELLSPDLSKLSNDIQLEIPIYLKKFLLTECRILSYQAKIKISFNPKIQSPLNDEYEEESYETDYVPDSPEISKDRGLSEDYMEACMLGFELEL